MTGLCWKCEQHPAAEDPFVCPCDQDKDLAVEEDVMICQCCADCEDECKRFVQ